MLDGPLFILSLPSLLVSSALIYNNHSDALFKASMTACALGLAYLGYRYHWVFYIPAGATVYTLVKTENTLL
jgi:hypothetical protein